MNLLVYSLVFFSGAAALVYEVVWGRQLATFLGITSYAHAAVLAAFMLGLALGSWVLGILSERYSRPLILFAQLELGIAVSAVAGLWLLPRLQRLYAGWAGGPELTPSSYLLRFGIALVALVVPTFLMGGTLPALVRGLEGRASRSVLVGRLYGLNTLGAACGALAAGYVLLPALGTRGTVLVAVAVNCGVGFLVLLPIWQRPATAQQPAPAPPPDEPPAIGDRALGNRALVDPHRRAVLAAFAVSGLAALALQMVWTRALTLVLGSSVYAFSTVLAVYLLGLGGGSLLFARRAARGVSVRGLLLGAVGLETVLAFSIVLGMPVLGRLPQLFVAGYRAGLQESFPGLQLFLVTLSATVILVPTLVLGALFPLIVSLTRTSRRGSGRDVGASLAANSLGTFLGAPAAVVVLLPTLGIARSLVALAAVQLLLAGLFLALRHAVTSALDSEDARSRRPTWSWRGLVAVSGTVALFAVCAATFGWDRVLMTSGPYINAFRLTEAPEGSSFREWLHQRNRLVYYWEGADATVSVRDDGEERLLVINGKTDGSRLGDRRTQVALGHLPLLAHPQPRRVLIVGLGTGITAAAVATHEDVEELEIVEVSPGVVAASAYFDDDNRGVLFDPRTRLIQADARNLLLTRAQRYDVIVSEPSNPWISGVANLFTREFFELAARRLEPGGVMAQWFQSYGMSSSDLRTAMATFQSVFPATTLWLPDTGDLVFLGSQQPHQLQWQRLRTILEGPLAAADLGPAQLLEARQFLRMFLLDREQVASYVARAPLNTDDRPRIELSAPRNLYRETTLSNLVELLAHRGDRSLEVPIAGLGRYDPSRHELSAFGLQIQVPPGDSAPGDQAAVWRVRWSTLVPVEQSRQPQIVVTQERLVTLDRPSGRLDIHVAPTMTGSDPDAGLDRLRHLLPGALATAGNAQLADGTAAVWAVARSPSTATLGVSWVCSASGSSWRYDAVLSVGRDGGDVSEVDSELLDSELEQVLTRVRCTTGEGW